MEKERVLLADGDASYLQYLSMVFAGAGFETKEASSCAELLAMLKENQEDKESCYHAIIMEYVMSDGFADSVLQAVRESSHLVDIPVVVLVDGQDKAIKQKLFEAGANEVLEKPVRRFELLARVHSMISFVRSLENKYKQEFHDYSRRLSERLEENREAMEEQVKSTLYRELVYSFTQGQVMLLSYEDFDAYIHQSLNCEFTTSFSLKSPFSISRARMVAEEQLEEACFDMDIADDILLCVSEAATNVIKHGGGGAMQLAFNKEEDCMYLLFTDNGNGIREAFLVNALFFAGASAKKSFGYGFKILLDIMDNISLATGPNGTRLLMRKNRIATRNADKVLDEILQRF